MLAERSVLSSSATSVSTAAVSVSAGAAVSLVSVVEVDWLLPVLSTVVPQPASKLTAIALVSKAAITFFFIFSLLFIKYLLE